jgi:mRNA interferase HicA
MKRRALEKKLRALKRTLVRHGRKHDVWTNEDGNKSEYVPRHSEINEQLAKAILKSAEEA